MFISIKRNLVVMLGNTIMVSTRRKVVAAMLMLVLLVTLLNNNILEYYQVGALIGFLVVAWQILFRIYNNVDGYMVFIMYTWYSVIYALIAYIF